MTAAYVFDAGFSVSAAEVSLSPDRFETTLRLFAPVPGESGAQIDWLFFRNRLWSGEISDEALQQYLGSSIHVVPRDDV